ncbi:MAG: helix-turn-helix domain-containing protein [Sedimentisphaerales bacterium]|nr:helix-turn-helix domain-containing protein [Sedimentisphaerales bacterium]
MQEEHLFIQDILKKHNLSVSQLALKAGMADSTVYEYTGGRRKNPPLAIWRALYELTRDVTVINLLAGDAESFIVPLPTPIHNGDTGETLKKLIEKRKMDIECETAILDILADGKIDKDDLKAIEHYRDAHPEALKLAIQIYHAIIDAYEKAIKQKK